MIHRPLRLALPIALAAGACASSPDTTAPQDLVGCYYFEQDQTAAALNLPWGVQLTPDSLTDAPPMDRQPDVRVAITLVDLDRTAAFPFGYWQTLPGDSLRIGYPGMGGFVLDLTVSEGDLVGAARPVGDAGADPQRPTHPVRLERARCPE